MSPLVRDVPLFSRYFHMFSGLFFFYKSPSSERSRRCQAEKCAGNPAKSESQRGRIVSRYLYHRPDHMATKRHRDGREKNK